MSVQLTCGDLECSANMCSWGLGCWVKDILDEEWKECMFDSQANINPLLWINRTRGTAGKRLKGTLLKICDSAFMSPRCNSVKHMSTLSDTRDHVCRDSCMDGWRTINAASFQFCVYLLQNQQAEISYRVWMNGPVLPSSAEEGWSTFQTWSE